MAGNKAWNAICREFYHRTEAGNKNHISLLFFTQISVFIKVKEACSSHNTSFAPRSNVIYPVEMAQLEIERSRLCGAVDHLPEEIPKPKFMNIIAEIIGSYCPQLGPVPSKESNFFSNHSALTKFKTIYNFSFRQRWDHCREIGDFSGNNQAWKCCFAIRRDYG